MPGAPIVTFLTDFGTRDTYVAQMKAAVLARVPEARLVDLTHDVAPGAIAEGAWLLETCAGRFPAGTVHVGVVDPGVGTDRRALLVVGGRGEAWVGPDNGLLARVLGVESGWTAWELDPARVADGDVAPTFHGRDVFAPAAARYAAERDPAALGARLADRALPAARPPGTLPAPGAGERRAVVHVDRFGNASVDVRLAGRAEGAAGIEVRCGFAAIRAHRRTFGEAAGSEPFLLVNSAGYLEIACNGVSAAARLGLAPGQDVVCRVL